MMIHTLVYTYGNDPNICSHIKINLYICIYLKEETTIKCQLYITGT